MSQPLISSQRVYLNADKTKAFPDGHKEAQSLLVAQGGEISEEDAAKYDGALELVKGEAEPKSKGKKSKDE